MSIKNHPAYESLLNAIWEKQAEDPLIGAKMASQFLEERIMSIMKDEKGIHIQTLLACLGSLAGYACQQACLAEGAELMIVTGKNQENYYFGEQLNYYLIEGQYSVWSLVGGVLEAEKSASFDVIEIVKHVVATGGTDNFAQPRLPENTNIRFQPKEYLELWQPLKEEILEALLIEPKYWALSYAILIQKYILEAKNIIPPKEAGQIVMECAIPMSKWKRD